MSENQLMAAYISFVVVDLVRLFGGLLADVRRRYRHYRSDITDGLNLQCLATIVFLYFACITPIVTFGGMLGQMTDDYMVSMQWTCPSRSRRWRFCPTVTSNGSPYATGPLSYLSVCL